MCGMEYRLKKGSVYEGKVEKVDFPNKATVWVTDEDGQKEKAILHLMICSCREMHFLFVRQ